MATTIRNILFTFLGALISCLSVITVLFAIQQVTGSTWLDILMSSIIDNIIVNYLIGVVIFSAVHIVDGTATKPRRISTNEYAFRASKGMAFIYGVIAPGGTLIAVFHLLRNIAKRESLF